MVESEKCMFGVWTPFETSHKKKILATAIYKYGITVYLYNIIIYPLIQEPGGTHYVTPRPHDIKCQERKVETPLIGAYK